MNIELNQKNRSNINIGFGISPICNFWRRIFAFIIDGSLFSIIGLILVINFFDFFIRNSIISFLFSYVIIIIYFGIFESILFKGQTLGKRLLKIKLVNRENEYLSLKKSVLRSTLFFLPSILGYSCYVFKIHQTYVTNTFSYLAFYLSLLIVYFYLFNTKTRQTLHDIVFSSYVVTVNNENKLNAFKIWFRHYIIAGILVLFLSISPFFLGDVVKHFLGSNWDNTLSEVTSLHDQIEKIDTVSIANVIYKTFEKDSAIKNTNLNIIVTLEKVPSEKDISNVINQIFLLYKKNNLNADKVSIAIEYGVIMSFLKYFEVINLELDMNVKNLDTSYLSTMRKGHSVMLLPSFY